MTAKQSAMESEGHIQTSDEEGKWSCSGFYTFLLAMTKVQVCCPQSSKELLLSRVWKDDIYQFFQFFSLVKLKLRTLVCLLDD